MKQQHLSRPHNNNEYDVKLIIEPIWINNMTAIVDTGKHQYVFNAFRYQIFFFREICKSNLSNSFRKSSKIVSFELHIAEIAYFSFGMWFLL